MDYTIDKSIDDSESTIKLYDTIATLARFKSNEITIAILCIEKIKINDEFCDKVDFASIRDCEFVGSYLLFDEQTGDDIIWSCKYGNEMKMLSRVQ